MNWEVFLNAKDNHNESIESYFDGTKSKKTVLVSFVRHLGCTYCKEMLSDLGEFKKEKGELPFKLLIVHMSSFSKADQLLKKYGLDGQRHVSDLDSKIYKAFDLKKGSISELFGLKVLFRSLKALPKHGVGMIDGDSLQMPGVFLVNKKGVLKTFKHTSVADKVDYQDFFDYQENLDSEQNKVKSSETSNNTNNRIKEKAFTQAK